MEKAMPKNSAQTYLRNMTPLKKKMLPISSLSNNNPNNIPTNKKPIHNKPTKLPPHLIHHTCFFPLSLSTWTVPPLTSNKDTVWKQIAMQPFIHNLQKLIKPAQNQIGFTDWNKNFIQTLVALCSTNLEAILDFQLQKILKTIVRTRKDKKKCFQSLQY